MKHSMNRTLAAALIATAAGLIAWFLGFARMIWPAHPQITAFLITVAVGIVVNQTWPADPGREPL
jgi:hypothetical protein